MRGLWQVCVEEDGKAALDQVRQKERDSGVSEDQIAKRCSTNVRVECHPDPDCRLQQKQNASCCRNAGSQVPLKYRSARTSGSPVHSKGSSLSASGSVILIACG